MAQIGFIGLGNMGAPMATNLLKAGHGLKVYDIVQSQVVKLVDAGATPCVDAASVVQGVDVLISMLPASAQVESLYLGTTGLMAAIAPDCLVVDCSTIAPSSARTVAAAATARGIAMLDAPVSGGVGGAVAGSLTFIVGGTEVDLARARPILADMGQNIFHAGGSGAGQAAKICNNMLLAVLMTGTAEALQLGVDNGLDPAVLSEIMRKSSGGNWALEVYNPYPGVMANAPAARDYEGGFLVDLMIKDLGLAMEAALATGAATPMGSLARNLFLGLRRQGFGRKDFSSIQRLFSDP
jgi:3-hydroxyisobutyrate dehydrogenase